MRAGGADEVADPPYAGPCRLGAEVGAGADDGTPGREGAREEGVALEEGDSGDVSTVGTAAGAGEGASEAGL